MRFSRGDCPRVYWRGFLLNAYMLAFDKALETVAQLKVRSVNTSPSQKPTMTIAGTWMIYSQVVSVQNCRIPRL